jgi:hypothetical protein
MARSTSARTTSKSRRRSKKSEPPRAINPKNLVAVHVFNRERGDFDAIPAQRVEPGVYEILEASAASSLGSGDLVRCELSDGELVVREQLFRTRLL